MELVIKNEQIKNAIEFEKKYNINGKPVEEGVEVYTGLSNTDRAMNILIGYLDSLVEIADYPEVDLKLDLTYGTLKNLPVAVAYEFVAGMNSGYTTAQNIEIAEKTIAAYFYLLAANEHNMEISGVLLDGVTESDTHSPALFGGLSIFAGNENGKNSFYNACIGSVKFSDNQLTILTSDVANEYKRLTGIDVKFLGIDNVQCVI